MSLKYILITLMSTVLINGIGNFFNMEVRQSAESAWAYAASDLLTTAVTGGMSSAPCGTFSGVPTAHYFEARHIEVAIKTGLSILLITLNPGLVGFIAASSAVFFVGLFCDMIIKGLFDFNAPPQIALRQIPMSIGAGLFVFAFNSPWFKALLISGCIVSFLLRAFAYWYDYKGARNHKTIVYKLLFLTQINLISSAIGLALLTSSLSLWIAVLTIMIIQVYFNYLFCENSSLFHNPRPLHHAGCNMQ